MIAKFSCACGHHWHVDLATAGRVLDTKCPGCKGVVTEAMKEGAEFDRSAELDALRDLRALVLLTESDGPWNGDGSASVGRWREIVKLARAAVTPKTFDPTRFAERRSPAGVLLCEVEGCERSKNRSG